MDETKDWAGPNQAAGSRLPPGLADGGAGRGVFRPDAQRGAVLEALFRAHGDCVYALALSLCGPVTAEVVTRDVFVEVCSAVDDVDGDDSWLRGRLLVAAVDRARAISEPGHGEGRSFRRRRQPGRLLAGLPDDEVLAVAMTAFGGYTYRQASRLLQHDEVKVRDDIRRGLRRIQDRALQMASPPE